MLRIKYNQPTLLISFIIILFIISSSYLFFTNQKYLDLNYNKNFWALYFENPKSKDLNFVIENHSDKNTFHYVISSGNDKIEEKDVLVSKGEAKNIKPAQINAAGKVVIEVSAGEDKKEIYKNF